MVARILAGLVGLLMTLSAINWILDPAAAAGSLGMSLLDGMGRSTQVGDFTSFFVCTGGFALWGAWKMEAPWVTAGAALLLGAAVFRTTAWAFHGADLAAPTIAVEIVSASLLLFAAWTFRKNA